MVENLENTHEQAEENTNHVFSHSRQPFVPPVSSLHEHGFAKLLNRASIQGMFILDCAIVAHVQRWLSDGDDPSVCMLPFGKHDRYLSHHPFKLSPTWTSLYQARPGPLPTISSAHDSITYIIISISPLLPIVYICDTAWRVRHI